MKIGNDAVVMGNVPPSTRVGDRSVYIGPTDANGNTILNTPMAVGYGAQAGPGSIAIGAFSGVGQVAMLLPAEIRSEFAGLITTAIETRNAELLAAIGKVGAAFHQPDDRKSAVFAAWEGVKAFDAVIGAKMGLESCTQALTDFFQSTSPG